MAKKTKQTKKAEVKAVEPVAEPVVVKAVVEEVEKIDTDNTNLNHQVTGVCSMGSVTNPLVGRPTCGMPWKTKGDKCTWKTG